MGKTKLSDVLSGLLRGAFIGLVPRLGLGIFAGMANLSHDYGTADFFRTIGNIVWLACTIIVGIKQSKVVKAERLASEGRRKYLADTEKRLKESLPREMAIIRQGFRYDSPESLERYGRACDNLVHMCSYYMVNEQSLDRIVAPYRKELESRTYAYVDWRGGRWTYVPGTEIAEEIHKSMMKLSQEKREQMERK